VSTIGQICSGIRMVHAARATGSSQAALVNPHEYTEGIRMPHAKFVADPFKTVAAVYNEQKTQTFSVYVSKITVTVECSLKIS